MINILYEELNNLKEDYSEDKEIALMDDNVQIGTALIRDYKDGEIFLTDFEIFPQFRGRGFGKSQLNKLINDYGVNSLTVAVDNSRAKHIYDKAGFKVVGDVYYDDNAKENVYYMKLECLTEDLSDGGGLSTIITNQLKSIHNKVSKQRALLNKLIEKENNLKSIQDTIYNNFIKDTKSAINEDNIIIDPDNFINLLLKYNFNLSDQMSLTGYTFISEDICNNKELWKISSNIDLDTDIEQVNIQSVEDLKNYKEFINNSPCELFVEIKEK